MDKISKIVYKLGDLVDFPYTGEGKPLLEVNPNILIQILEQDATLRLDAENDLEVYKTITLLLLKFLYPIMREVNKRGEDSHSIKTVTEQKGQLWRSDSFSIPYYSFQGSLVLKNVIEQLLLHSKSLADMYAKVEKNEWNKDQKRFDDECLPF